MMLAHAIRKNVVSLAAAQNTYKHNVVAVNTLATGVLSSSLPTLHEPPPDWSSFASIYEEANGDALNWVNEVMARLLNVPDDIRSYNESISLLLEDAKKQANDLLISPKDQQAKSALDNDLKNLSTRFSLVLTFISGALKAIKGFQDKLPDMAVKLQNIADKSTHDARVDQTKINQLNQDIDNLHAEINTLAAAIAGLAIADGIALTLGTVTTIAAWPIGAVTWFVLGPAVAVATTFIALNAVKIVEHNKKIEADKKEMTGLTADVATLHILTKNFAALASEAKQVETNLQAVLREWQTLETDVNQAIADIRTAIADQAPANYQDIMEQLSDASDEWKAAYSQAGALHLDIKVNTATLQIGMSSEQVKAATDSAQTMNIIDYYNSTKPRGTLAA